MSRIEKLIQKIISGKNVSYQEAENLLLSLGFQQKLEDLTTIFRKQGYPRTITIKRRKLLYDYQIDDLKEVLKDHGY